MKKNKLIELLESIDGNPDIKLWNGFVGDWVDISPEIQQHSLFRQKLDHWLEMCRLEDCLHKKDMSFQLPDDEVKELKRRYRVGEVCRWEMNPYVTAEDIAAKKYSEKTVYIMQAKIKGTKSFDRMGDISY